MDGLIPTRSLTALHIPKFPMAPILRGFIHDALQHMWHSILELTPLFSFSPRCALNLPAHHCSYDTAALAGGYSIDDPAEFASRVTALMGGNVGSSSSAAPEVAEEQQDEEVTAEVVE